MGVKHLLAILITLFILIILQGGAYALASDSDAAEQVLGKTKKAAIIDAVTGAYNEGYVFPDVAKEMENTLRKKLKKGGYDAVKTLPEFVMALTRDLLEVSKDRHVSVRYLNPKMMKMPADVKEPEDAVSQDNQMRRQNYMFKKLEILAGNVGYLRMDMFPDASMAGPTAVAAMGFLANCDAIIFDLRNNGGGSPSMIQLLTSYLVKEPTHLNSFYIRKTDETRQFWTQSHIPGPSLADAEIYVLTSSYTFSGAEEFTYNLKNLKRATIIGETTGGGAHPVEPHTFPELGIMAIVPFGRAINPISGTNWEGTGITPHIEVPADKAMDTAYLEALKKLKKKTKNPIVRAEIEWELNEITASLNPPDIQPEVLEKYAGIYGDRKIMIENGKALYQRLNRDWSKMIPMTDTLFSVEGFDFFRLEVVLDENGDAIKLIGHYQDGSTDESLRDQ